MPRKRASAYIPKKSLKGPDKVECEICGRASDYTPGLTMKVLVKRLLDDGWAPAPDEEKGAWVCPECASELTDATDEDIDT